MRGALICAGSWPVCGWLQCVLLSRHVSAGAVLCLMSVQPCACMCMASQVIDDRDDGYWLVAWKEVHGEESLPANASVRAALCCKRFNLPQLCQR